MHKLPIPPKEDLERMYHDEDMMQKEIGEKYGASPSCVYIWFKNYGIQTKSRSDLRNMYLRRHNGIRQPRNITDILRYICDLLKYYKVKYIYNGNKRHKSYKRYSDHLRDLLEYHSRSELLSAKDHIDEGYHIIYHTIRNVWVKNIRK